MSMQPCDGRHPLDAVERGPEALLFKALADPSRLSMLATLARAAEGVCVCDFTDALPLNQPTVSHHLRSLRDAALVTCERRGTWVYYRLAGDARSRVERAVGSVFSRAAGVRHVLFVCIHNSARSQMAEAFVNSECGGFVRAFSAGLQRGTLNPVVVDAMREIGIDISGHSTKAVDDPDVRSRPYDYVVTVCDEASAEACPVYASDGRRMHWGFPDPSAFEGSPQERLARTREVRDAIAARVRAWCAEVCR